MDFEDPIAFNHLDSYVSGEPLPMIKITSLSNIWLPSHLLQNRGKSIISNLNKPGIYRTLEKHTITDCFSVYAEPDPQTNELKNSPSEDDSSDEFSQADMLDLLNDYSSPSTTDNTKESFIDEEPNFPTESQVVSSQFQNCSYQESGNPSEVDAVLNSQQEKFSLNDESDCLAKSQMKHDLSDTNKVTIVKTISDSLKDSLEDVYNSEDEDLSQNNSSISQREINSHLDFDAKSDHPSNSVSRLLERVNTNLYDLIKLEEKQLDIHQSDITIPSDCHKSLEDNSAKKLQIKYPIAYKKPAIEEVVGKQKKQKVKKNKASREKKALIVDKLEDADYDEPQVDHFYEHVMRQESCKSYASEFPSLHKKSNNNYIDNTERMYTFEGKTPESNWSKNADVPHEQPASSISKEFEVMEEGFRFEHEDEGHNISKIVIEKIPLGVTDTQLHSVILGFGELKNFSMRRCGKYMKAELRMDSIRDVDWMIECLNGNQPFGTTSEPLKCYKLC